MCAVTAIITVLLCINLQSSLASNAIDPKGNPVPENPTTLPSASVGRSDSPGSPGNVPVSSTTLGSILFPSAAPPAAGNDTHCENNVSDNDNITVPLIPAAPVPVSSTTTSTSTSAFSSTTTTAPLSISSATTTTSAPSVSSQPSSPEPVNNNLSTSPAPGGVVVTEATTQAASSTTAGGIGNISVTLGVVSSTPETATIQNSREGKNIDIQANASSSSSVSTGDLPRGYYLPPKNA